MEAGSRELRRGAVVGERYAVDGVLGRGGMGTVYSATHLLTQRRVAVKLLGLGEPCEREERESRFLSEARNAVAVRHRNVVDVLDMGLHHGEPYLVMEHLVGESLDALLARFGPLSPADALAILLPIMGALATLHDRGIVHRDVKPSNIFLARSDVGSIVPKLLDFGLSRSQSDVRLTRAGVVLGTPLYMAPEHAAGKGALPQSDVWSMGVVAFECLTGMLPYASTEPNVVATMVLAGHVRPLSEVGSGLGGVPDALCATIDQALERELDLRHADMRAFAEALVGAALSEGMTLPDDPEPVGLPDYRRWLSGVRPVLARPTTSVGARPGIRPTGARQTSQPVPGRRPPPRYGLAVAGAVVCAVLGVGWLGAHGGPSAEAPHAPTSGTRPARPDVALMGPPASAPLPSVEPIPSAVRDAGAEPAVQRPSASPPLRSVERARRAAAKTHGSRQLEEPLETEWK